MAVTPLESGGVTQGSSRRFALTSVAVGQEPQEGRCSELATRKDTDSLAIETRWCSGLRASSDLHRSQDVPPRGANEESTPTRARREGGESLGEETRAHTPCPGRKAGASVRGPVEPQERSRHETRLAWLRAEQDVKAVRNREDGRCRRLDSPGQTDACFCRALKGMEPQERCSPVRMGLRLTDGLYASRRRTTR
jgi:hypothetical protein